MENVFLDTKTISISILDVRDEDLESFLTNLKTIKDKHNLNNIIIHFDVMDGIFVNNIGIDIGKISIVKEFGFFCDVHLMVKDAEKYMVEAFKLGADSITIHNELENIDSQINKLIDLKKLVNNELSIGIAINPKSKLDNVIRYSKVVDNILIMTVNPGYGGQAFMSKELDKIPLLVDKVKVLQVDGGITASTIKAPIKLGVKSFVIGSYFTGNYENLEERLLTIFKLINDTEIK